jgi:hypothetical protein
MILLVLLCALSLALAQPTCLSGSDVSGPGSDAFNQACVATPLTPYCPQGNGKCSPCDPAKSKEQSICDCPANQYCFSNGGSPTRFGTCQPFNSGSIACTSTRQCYDNLENYYWSCVGGFCRPCNTTFYGTSVTTCGGGSPYPASSRPGETRQCGSDGYFVGGGAITSVPTSPSSSTTGTTAPRTSAASTYSSSLSLVVAVALMFLLL